MMTTVGNELIIFDISLDFFAGAGNYTATIGLTMEVVGTRVTRRAIGLVAMYMQFSALAFFADASI